jgi:cyclopropane fatty-acyl-phospholipid synthase-like methyltransferase
MISGSLKKKKYLRKKFQSEICDEKMTFEECELAILRNAVDETESIKRTKAINNEDVQRMLKIVENFIKKKNLICYGGTAINNILPKEDQFYDKDVEIPDYDFFTTNALEDAKELSNIYFKEGFTDVEAKSGQHHGTFKVYVNIMM